MSDKEHAYQRAIEVLNECEADLKLQMNGRELAFGPWKYPREILMADLRVKLYDSDARGVQLDEYLYQYFDGVARRRMIQMVVPAISSQVRLPNTARRSDHEGTRGYVGDNAAARAEQLEIMADDPNDLFRVW